MELIKWRERNNCSQGILSIVLGVDIVTVSRWERDVQKIPPFLHYALKHIEQKRNVIADAIERRSLQRRADAERRTIKRRILEKAADLEKRAAKRRTSARRAPERRSAD